MTVSRSLRDERRVLRSLMPIALLGLMLVAFFVIPGFSGKQATSFNVYNALQAFSALGLVALALGITMIAGEFDLSVLGMFGLAGMVAVKAGGDSAVLGVLAALAVAVVVGVVQGLIVARFRVQSTPVTLGGYLVLLGLTAALGSSKSVSYSNLNVGETLDTQHLEIFSWRSAIAIGAFVGVALVLRYTRLGRDVRAIGGDRRASRTVGVRVDRLLVMVFVLSATLSALGGSLLAYSLATATPDPGITPLVFAVTAALLGGVRLAGGTGTALGIAAGALTLSFLRELFSVLATPDYVSSLVTGALLLLATVATAPDLVRWLRSHRAARPRTAPAS
jgi:ribose/xylose/arabinose/galactoside ABC-type transport system permease subunit